MVLSPFQWSFFNNAKNNGKFGIDLVDLMLKIPDLRIGKYFSAIYYHMKTLPYTVKNKYYSMIYVRGIVKYVIQSLVCVMQGIYAICARFHIFPKIIKGAPFHERSKYHFSQF